MSADEIEATGLFEEYGLPGDSLSVEGYLEYDGYSYPYDYGEGCKAHDSEPIDLPPYCTTNPSPSWCKDEFCYVDCDKCDLPFKSRSAYFPNADLCYSYQTCGGNSTFEDWYGNTTGYRTVNDLKEVVEVYLLELKEEIEKDFKDFDSMDDEDRTGCTNGVNCLCRCESCVEEESWGNEKVDFTRAGFTPTLSAPVDSSVCLTNKMQAFFAKTALKEYTDKNRIAYIYSALQVDGSYTQWPAMEWCPTNYNPFLRAWYSAAAGGTNRAVALVLDCSGSMYNGNRQNLAKEAAKQIISSLTYFDKIKIILFNSAVEEATDWTQTTESNKEVLETWIDSYYSAGGGTDFYIPLNYALNAFSSVPSSCDNIILFMTDGQANDWSDSYYTTISNKIQEKDAIIFTYALGDGAEIEIIKKLACQNDGIHYYIPDSGDLSLVMGSYYSYFVVANTTSEPTWIIYEDFVTSDELVASCIPFDHTSTPTSTTKMRELIGVVCMDMNMLANLDVLKEDQNLNYDSFLTTITDDSQKCHTRWSSNSNDEKRELLEILRAQESCKGAATCEDTSAHLLSQITCDVNAKASDADICPVPSDDDGSGGGGLSGDAIGMIAGIIFVVVIFIGLIICTFDYIVSSLRGMLSSISITSNSVQPMSINHHQNPSPLAPHSPGYGSPINPHSSPGYGSPVNPHSSPGYGSPVNPHSSPGYGSPINSGYSPNYQSPTHPNHMNIPMATLSGQHIPQATVYNPSNESKVKQKQMF